MPFNIFDKKTNERLFSGKILGELLGYTEEELNAYARSKFIEIIHPDDRKVSKGIDDELNASKDGEHIEKILRFRHKKGYYLHFQVFCSVYERDENGRMISCLGFANNISDQLELEEKLRKASEVINKMQYSNSHELRGPVSNIMGLVKMLDSTDFMFDHQRKLVKTLCKTVSQLDQVIHNINDLGHSAPNHVDRTEEVFVQL